MKLGVVLTDSYQSHLVSSAARCWNELRKLNLVPELYIVQATNTPEESGLAEGVHDRVVAAEKNPGYYAPPGTLHGHHSNLNAGVSRLLEKDVDVIYTSCGDIAPLHPMLLVDILLASGRDVGLAYAPWETKTPREARVVKRGVKLNRFQDDVMCFTRRGAERMFPIGIYDVEPYWSEVSLHRHVEHLGMLDEVCVFEDMRDGWRYYWYEMHGFMNIGPDRPGVQRPEKRRM